MSFMGGAPDSSSMPIRGLPSGGVAVVNAQGSKAVAGVLGVFVFVPPEAAVVDVELQGDEPERSDDDQDSKDHRTSLVRGLRFRSTSKKAPV